MNTLRQRPALVGLVLLLLFVVPLAIAAGVLGSHRWYPTGDLAQTEMRVRAVWSAHPPLIGLPGRIGPLADQGSHPGPASFWLLWPIYALLGGRAWGLVVGSVVLHITSIAVALWLARRRGGVALMVALAASLAVLVRAYGTAILTVPWNPYLPVMAWMVVLLAAWSVLCEDLATLPVLVLAASFCMQTHLPYLGLAGALVGLVAAVVAVRAVLRRRDPTEVRSALRWVGIALVVGVVAWIPPVVDQLSHSTGNLTMIVRDLQHPPQAPGGWGQGVKLVLVHLDPWRLVTRKVLLRGDTASVLPGTALLVVWLASTIAAWRPLRHRRLVALDGTIGAALVLALISGAKIYGELFFYLTLWAWGLTALVVLAVGWTAWELVAGRLGDAGRERGASMGVLGLGAVALIVASMFAVDARKAEYPSAKLSTTLGHVVAPTVAALRHGRVVGDRGHGPYLVTWTDPLAIGNQGYGLLDELDRAGFQVGVDPVNRGGVWRHQLVTPATARAIVHLSVGSPDIQRCRRLRGVREVAYWEPRTSAERAESERLRAEVIADLHAHGLDRFIPAVDVNLVFVAVLGVIPATDRAKLTRIVDLGLPVAVFVAPPTTDPGAL